MNDKQPKQKNTQTADAALAHYFSDLTHSGEEVLSQLEVASKLLQQANLDYIEQEPLTHIEPQSNISTDHVALFTPPLEDAQINAQKHKENDALVETVENTKLNSQQSLQQRLPNRFQVLLFEVAGLKLAAPLTELGRLVELGEVSQLPGKPSWFMGLLLQGGEKQYCVDTAQVISPERYEQFNQKGIDYAYALQLGDSSWSLACSSFASTHELDKNEVNWRENAKNRPWFAGMIKQQMCALIDVGQMIQQLESGPTNTLHA